MNINLTQGKEDIIQSLESLSKKLSRIEYEFSIDISVLISKVNKAIENIKYDIFSIAFFGAFSDGKSTILSTIIDKLDIDISPEPTTDKVQTYLFKDYKIIDTPGLFSENLIHDERTKKYISEANIIIYTVDPVNPLKESQLQTVKWLLADLKKIESTIFVINKMDEVSDLEDDEDFHKNSIIKKKVVSDAIHEVIGVNNNLKIICISADPFGQGLKFWKENHNYKKLSRIESLELLISEFKTTYKNDLIVKAGVSVIRDTSVQTLSELNEIKISLISEADLLGSQINEYNNRIQVLEKDISRSYINIKEEFISLRGDVLVDIDAVSNMQELSDVIQKRLGKDGYILQEKIDLIIKKHTGNLLTESKEIFKSLEESLIYHSKLQNEILGKLSDTGKSVIKGMLSSPTRKIADAVIKARDFLKLPFKFKPWDALKFAKFLKAMPIVMEVIQFAGSIWSKIKMDKKRNEIKNELENAFKGLIQNMTQESYTENYFPFTAETKKVLLSLEDSKRGIEQTIASIDEISSQLNVDNLG
ncbi:LeoA/HP0731 family dynamin-like GTPase [Thiothrix winogradskyi]|uniref:Dynamin family protein n=1 Tax=Thiothrix winogradskyi TaxID=96472 RepID=A0ABY3SYW6_9GAMM|nr:LeoA/HP0731 family dynamin-like GTPase [Thiothrix winogradskyi]UJS23829.1 dynamin family protein [Thiothrix winogradskyi]